MGYPEHLGGTPAPAVLRNALTQTLASESGSGGLMASLFSHNIGLPPVLRWGSDALQREVIPPVLRGEKIAALAITEPGGGTDVAALRTTARLDGDHYVVDGEKVFITSGMRADYLTVAVRTDAGNKGRGGISMLVVPGDAPGLSRSPLQKMGWHCSDTAHLRFDGVRVPARFLVGQEGSGFKMIMGNFNGERLSMAVMALGFAECCYREALDWARTRKTFGSALVEHQVVRHKLMDMKMRIESTRAWLNAVSARADSGNKADKGAEWVAQVKLPANVRLAIDIDPQGSLTTLHGILPEAEVSEEMTIAPLCNGTSDDITPAIRSTYWDGIDLVAAAPFLFSAEFALPARQMQEAGARFWDVLNAGLEPVRDLYDVIVIDTPPSQVAQGFFAGLCHRGQQELDVFLGGAKSLLQIEQ